MNPSIDNSAARPRDTIDPYNGYINADDAARLYGTTVETLRRYRRKGLIHGILRFKRRFYSRDELRALFSPTES